VAAVHAHHRVADLVHPVSRAKGEFTEKTRALIMARFDGRCYYCGLRVEGNGQIHHRLPRRLGGSGSLLVSDIANGVYLHGRCHDRIESQREKAIINGWILKMGSDPTVIPITTGWKGTVSLASSDAA
jgi:5-methylcytosine-specific restriction protein A